MGLDGLQSSLVFKQEHEQHKPKQGGNADMVREIRPSDLDLLLKQSSLRCSQSAERSILILSCVGRGGLTSLNYKNKRLVNKCTRGPVLCSDKTKYQRTKIQESCGTDSQQETGGSDAPKNR